MSLQVVSAGAARLLGPGPLRVPSPEVHKRVPLRPSHVLQLTARYLIDQKRTEPAARQRVPGEVPTSWLFDEVVILRNTQLERQHSQWLANIWYHIPSVHTTFEGSGTSLSLKKILSGPADAVPLVLWSSTNIDQCITIAFSIYWMMHCTHSQDSPSLPCQMVSYPQDCSFFRTSELLPSPI